MGVVVRGLDEWRRDLETLPERAPKAFHGVMSRAGVQIKLDWQARWNAIKAPRTHIPHIVRGIGYDQTDSEDHFAVTVGVRTDNRQAFLSKILEYGTLTSPPHPAGEPALHAEVPQMMDATGTVAVNLLLGRSR